MVACASFCASHTTPSASSCSHQKVRWGEHTMSNISIVAATTFRVTAPPAAPPTPCAPPPVQLSEVWHVTKRLHLMGWLHVQAAGAAACVPPEESSGGPALPSRI